MEPSAVDRDVTARDPYLPPMFRTGDILSPKAPETMAAAGLDEGVLVELGVKLAYSATRFTTDWVCKRLHVSLPLAMELLEQMVRETLIEVTLKSTEGRSHYRITERGRMVAERALQVCAYVGPAPVSLESYGGMLRWQFANTEEVKPEHVKSALAGLVLSPKAAQLAGLAVSSGRSLFVYGPPGNGKSSLGRQIHAALVGDYWIPYCLSAGNTVIRLFDEQMHERVAVTDRPELIDQRWVRIRRPLVIVGGELTLEFLDV